MAKCGGSLIYRASVGDPNAVRMVMITLPSALSLIAYGVSIGSHMNRPVQLSRGASVLAIEIAFLVWCSGCSRQNAAPNGPPNGRAAAEAAIRQALPSRAITFRDEQSFTATGHPGAIVCGVYRSEQTGDVSFIWGAGNSVYPGLKTQSSIGVDPFLRAQIAYCVDLPSDADADAGSANAQSSQQGSNTGVSIL